MIRIKTDQLDLAQRAAGMATTAELARAMGLNKTSVARALRKEQAGQDFVTGAHKAFRLLHFDDLFRVAVDGDEAISA